MGHTSLRDVCLWHTVSGNTVCLTNWGSSLFQQQHLVCSDGDISFSSGCSRHLFYIGWVSLRDHRCNNWAQTYLQGSEKVIQSAIQMKRKREQANGSGSGSGQDTEQQPKEAKTTRKPRSSRNRSDMDKAKLNKIISTYGVLPLQDTAISNPTKSKPETILALVYLAMLSSARISHQLAYKTLQYLIEAGYHKLDILMKSSWDERTKVLTKGGYTRYREKTATALGQLAELIDQKYGLWTSQIFGILYYTLTDTAVEGDLNNLLKLADRSPKKVRSLIQEIKNIGKVGCDIFFDVAQSVWPSLAPFVDPRSIQTAQRLGLGNSVDAMWEAVDRDPVQMCKLSWALTTIRLEKRFEEFEWNADRLVHAVPKVIYYVIFPLVCWTFRYSKQKIKYCAVGFVVQKKKKQWGRDRPWRIWLVKWLFFLPCRM